MRAKPVADRLAAVVVACLVLGHAADAFAAPLEWPVAEGGNGHFYEYVTTGPFPRDAALVQAAGRTYAGVSGHLATLTSEPEWAFVVNRFDAIGRQAWIGGQQAPGSPTPSEGWYWITGEPWEFAPWGQYFVGVPEPNDAGGSGPGEDGGEDYLALFGDELDPGLAGNRNYGMFNDEGGTFFISGYMVEYPVPEPGTAALLAASFAIALGRGARRARPPRSGWLQRAEHACPRAPGLG